MPDPNTMNSPIIDAVAKTVHAVSDSFVPAVHDFVEKGTERVGRIVTPVVDHPLVKYATKVPLLKWLMAVLGQVNTEEVERDIKKLKEEHPLENREQLTQRVIKDTAWKAAGVGLITNFVPPLALAFMPLDIAAVTVLQAEMIYRIAAIYGFSTDDPTRRGEILAIWWLSINSSGFIKAGFSILEIIPVVGTVIGVTSDAALLTFVGNVASRYYEEKLK